MAHHQGACQSRRDNRTPLASVLIIQRQVVEVRLVDSSQKEGLEEQGANDFVSEQNHCSRQLSLRRTGSALTWKHRKGSHLPFNQEKRNERTATYSKHTYHHG